MSLDHAWRRSTYGPSQAVRLSGCGTQLKYSTVGAGASQMKLRLWNSHSSTVRDSPKPFGPKSAGPSSIEQRSVGIVYLPLDGPHMG